MKKKKRKKLYYEKEKKIYKNELKIQVLNQDDSNNWIPSPYIVHHFVMHSRGYYACMRFCCINYKDFVVMTINLPQSTSSLTR